MMGWIICPKPSSEISRRYFSPAGQSTSKLRRWAARKAQSSLQLAALRMRATVSPWRRASVPKIESQVAANVVERDGDQQIVDVVAA